MLATGTLDSEGLPVITIEISGAGELRQEFKAVIDTGFSGFVAVPFDEGKPLGLETVGTAKMVLADGSTVLRVLTLGTAHLQSESRLGVIVLEPGAESALLGMEFLKLFGLSLLLSDKTVILATAADLPVSKS